MTAPLITVDDVAVHFPVEGGGLRRQVLGTVKALDGITFTIKRGETLGLVGESGCGKSTVGRVIMNLLAPSEGRVSFDGKDLTRLKSRQRRELRKRMQMVYQDPYASLNPRMTVGQIVGDPLAIHGLYRGRKKLERIQYLLDIVGLGADCIDRYPHQFSGGQRQRVGIARALAVDPEFIVLDESIAALDVSIQAQIINLLQKLQAELGLTYLFISHDLSVVRHISDRVAVMYLGKIVEIGSSEQIYQNPMHPYTQALLASVPVPDPVLAVARGAAPLKGELPSRLNPPQGCRFSDRCPKATSLCREQEPFTTVREPGHMLACHHA